MLAAPVDRSPHEGSWTTWMARLGRELLERLRWPELGGPGEGFLETVAWIVVAAALGAIAVVLFHVWRSRRAVPPNALSGGGSAGTPAPEPARGPTWWRERVALDLERGDVAHATEHLWQWLRALGASSSQGHRTGAPAAWTRRELVPRLGSASAGPLRRLEQLTYGRRPAGVLQVRALFGQLVAILEPRREDVSR